MGVKHIFLRVITSWFGLGVINLVYLFLGALIFHTFESGEEQTIFTSLQKDRKEMVIRLYDHVTMKKKGKPAYEAYASQELGVYETSLVRYYRKRLSAGKGKDNETLEDSGTWTRSGAIVYAYSVITTIGWGNVVPATIHGRLATIVYGFVGVPLLFTLSTEVGYMTNWLIRFFYFSLVYKCGREGDKTMNRYGQKEKGPSVKFDTTIRLSHKDEYDSGYNHPPPPPYSMPRTANIALRHKYTADVLNADMAGGGDNEAKKDRRYFNSVRSTLDFLVEVSKNPTLWRDNQKDYIPEETKGIGRKEQRWQGMGEKRKERDTEDSNGLFERPRYILRTRLDAIRLSEELGRLSMEDFCRTMKFVGIDFERDILKSEGFGGDMNVGMLLDQTRYLSLDEGALKRGQSKKKRQRRKTRKRGDSGCLNHERNGQRQLVADQSMTVGENGGYLEVNLDRENMSEYGLPTSTKIKRREEVTYDKREKNIKETEFDHVRSAVGLNALSMLCEHEEGGKTQNVDDQKRLIEDNTIKKHARDCPGGPCTVPNKRSPDGLGGGDTLLRWGTSKTYVDVPPRPSSTLLKADKVDSENKTCGSGLKNVFHQNLDKFYPIIYPNCDQEEGYRRNLTFPLDGTCTFRTQPLNVGNDLLVKPTSITADERVMPNNFGKASDYENSLGSNKNLKPSNSDDTIASGITLNESFDPVENRNLEVGSCGDEVNLDNPYPASAERAKSYPKYDYLTNPGRHTTFLGCPVRSDKEHFEAEQERLCISDSQLLNTVVKVATSGQQERRVNSHYDTTTVDREHTSAIRYHDEDDRQHRNPERQVDSQHLPRCFYSKEATKPGLASSIRSSPLQNQPLNKIFTLPFKGPTVLTYEERPLTEAYLCGKAGECVKQRVLDKDKKQNILNAAPQHVHVKKCLNKVLTPHHARLDELNSTLGKVTQPTLCQEGDISGMEIGDVKTRSDLDPTGGRDDTAADISQSREATRLPHTCEYKPGHAEASVSPKQDHTKETESHKIYRENQGTRTVHTGFSPRTAMCLHPTNISSPNHVQLSEKPDSQITTPSDKGVQKETVEKKNPQNNRQIDHFVSIVDALKIQHDDQRQTVASLDCKDKATNDSVTNTVKLSPAVRGNVPTFRLGFMKPQETSACSKSYPCNLDEIMARGDVCPGVHCQTNLPETYNRYPRSRLRQRLCREWVNHQNFGLQFNDGSKDDRRLKRKHINEPSEQITCAVKGATTSEGDEEGKSPGQTKTILSGSEMKGYNSRALPVHTSKKELHLFRHRFTRRWVEYSRDHTQAVSQTDLISPFEDLAPVHEKSGNCLRPIAQQESDLRGVSFQVNVFQDELVRPCGSTRYLDVNTHKKDKRVTQQKAEDYFNTNTSNQGEEEKGTENTTSGPSDQNVKAGMHMWALLGLKTEKKKRPDRWAAFRPDDNLTLNEDLEILKQTLGKSAIEDEHTQDAEEEETDVPLTYIYFAMCLFLALGAVTNYNLDPEAIADHNKVKDLSAEEQQQVLIKHSVKSIYFAYVLCSTTGFGDILPEPEAYLFWLFYCLLGVSMFNITVNGTLAKMTSILDWLKYHGSEQR